MGRPALIFVTGFISGALALLWAIGRSTTRRTSIPLRIEQEWRVPMDPYVDGLPW